MKIIFEVPIKTVSEMNSYEHWSKKAKRHKQQQLFTRLAFKKYIDSIELPCEIKLTRLASRMLDDDNLPPSLKYIKDEIADILVPEKGGWYLRNGNLVAKKGHSDNDKRLSWVYAQEKTKSQGIRIEISF